MIDRNRAFSEVVRSGPFAFVYWTTTGLGLIALVVGFWLPTEVRVVLGFAVFIVVVTLIAARWIVATRFSRRGNSTERD